jgi:hypothetical protein
MSLSRKENLCSSFKRVSEEETNMSSAEEELI